MVDLAEFDINKTSLNKEEIIMCALTASATFAILVS